MLRILDFNVVKDERGNKYNEKCKSKSPRSFIIAFDIVCEQCKHRDLVKVSNIGWQGGEYRKTPAMR